MLVKDEAYDVDRFVRTCHRRLPLEHPLIAGVADHAVFGVLFLMLAVMVVMSSDVVSSAVESESMGATIFSEDFCWNLSDFLVEVIEVVCLEDHVYTLVN